MPDIEILGSIYEGNEPLDLNVIETSVPADGMSHITNKRLQYLLYLENNKSNIISGAVEKYMSTDK